MPPGLTPSRRSCFRLCLMNDVGKWLQSGAGVQEGLRLLNIYAPNRHLETLVRLNPERYRKLLHKALSKFSDSAPAQFWTNHFRNEWPFLKEPSCPPELKILAADKITAYHNYVAGHEELFACETLEECFFTAKKVIENYRQNRKILSEFTYYKEHHSCLGKHPIFASLKRISSLRKMSIVALLKKQKNLQGAIWRIRSEISKGNKPHLLDEREARLKAKEMELTEVTRLIEEYGKD